MNSFANTQELEGRVALVSGAAGGLGQVEARELAAAGAQVVLNGRSQSAELEMLARELGASLAIADLGTPEGARSAVQQTIASHGRIDVLVANHAAMTMSPLVDADLDDWWRILDVNLRGTFALVQEAARDMRRRSEGRVIVISSEWGVVGWPEATAYSASKAGLISLVKSLGRELGPEGIIVNAIAPGVIDTPQLAVDAQSAGLSIEAMHAVYAEQIPLGRIGQPHEIAQAVRFLADFRIGSIVGQTLHANGGATRARA